MVARIRTPRSLAWLTIVALGCAGTEPDGGADTDSSDGDTSTTAASTSATATTTTTASTATASTTTDPSSDPSGDPSSDPSGDSSSDDGDSSGAGGPPVGCVDYDAFDATVVGFRSDVMPIFAASCASCHADPAASIYFGAGGTTEQEAAAVHAKLLTGTPKQAPDLAFVAPGDPLHSYMLAKIEYEIPGATCSEVQCTEPGCELPAPPAGPLSDVDKGVLRSWIIGGALDD